MNTTKKGDVWGAFDKNGNTVIDFEYEGFGYVASSNKDAINLLIIPDYNMIIAQKNKKYALINSTGKIIIDPILDDIYMTISSGKKYYYMNANNQTFNVEEWLDSWGVKPQNGRSSNTNNNNKTTEQNEETE